MGGGLERPSMQPPTGEALEKKQDQLSERRDVYFRLAVDNGFTPENMEGIILEIPNGAYPANFSGEIKGKKFSASKDSKGQYSVYINNEQVRDDFLAEQLYRKYYPVARLMAMKTTTFVESGMKDINELL